jgi:metal-sulfur cluster biosynthetic enzyme
MNSEMTRKIDAVLDRVKEPESGLSMSQLGLVERLRYSEKKEKLFVFTCFMKPNHHYCCTVLQGLLISGVKDALTAEFQKEFPDLSVEFV